MSDSEHTLISAQVPTALRDELHRFAQQDDRSMSSVIRRALQTHLRASGVGAPAARVGPAVRRRGPEEIAPAVDPRQQAGPT